MPGNLVIVDIQPEYADVIHFDIAEFVHWAFIENHFDSAIFLYNGPDLGMSDQDAIINWLIERYTEETDDYDAAESLYWQMKRIDWFDKGYGFFRDVMDAGYDDSDIVSLGKHMIEHSIRDVREFDEDDWIAVGVDEDLRESLEDEGLAFYLPWAFDEIKDLPAPVLVGGGINECLREVQLVFEMIDRPYTNYSPFTY